MEYDAAQLARHQAYVRGAIPLFDTIGLEIVSMAPGSAVVEAPPGPNVNHFGVWYAGSLFSLGEVLGGLVAAATWDVTGYVPLVADMQVHFRRPALGTIRASTSLAPDEADRVARELAAGAAKVGYELHAVLVDGGGVEVASTTGRYALVRTDRAS